MGIRGGGAMSNDEPDGYLDDIAETRETEALRRSGDDWSSTVPTSRIGSSGSDPFSPPSGSEPLPSRASTSSAVTEEPPSAWAERGKRWLRFTRTMLVTALVLAG